MQLHTMSCFEIANFCLVSMVLHSNSIASTHNTYAYNYYSCYNVIWVFYMVARMLLCGC